MQTSNPAILIYGANGYSAQLILEELIRRGIRPLLAGRNQSEVVKIAQKYLCECRVFDLTNKEIICEKIKDVHTLLNCAGPFTYTARQLMEACLETKTNYLDITGEIEVIEIAWELNSEAKEKGIVILPSTGFDVIPTDCLSKRLSERMPDAVTLKLGFLNLRGKISRGTWLTTIEMMGRKGKIRVNGKIIDSEIGEKFIRLKFDRFDFTGISIPWGDVASAYYSTGIPNVEVYMGLPGKFLPLRHLMKLIRYLFSFELVQNSIKGFAKRKLFGPDENVRNNAKAFVWGLVENQKGETYREAYYFMEGYNLTAKGTAESVIRVSNSLVTPGTKTPSLAFGSDFMNDFILEKINSN